MQTQSNITNPIIKWAQRKKKVFITIDAVEVKNPLIDIVDGKVLKFQGTDSNHKYGFEIELYDEVVKDDSKYTLDSRNIFLNIEKKTAGPFWPRLTQENKKLNWVQVDWKHYVDEDEEEENEGPKFANEQSKYNSYQLDFPGFGGFGGDDEIEDEDDVNAHEEQGHVHGANCDHDHDHKQANLDDLDSEETK